jgi:hypothetical protein
MSDPQKAGEPRTDTSKRGRGRAPGSCSRASKRGHRIPLDDGDALVPRDDKAEALRVSSKTIQRHAPTVMIGGVAYVRDMPTNKAFADRSKPKRKHRRTGR